MELINFELIRNPLNWIVVILMLAIAVFALHLLQQPLNTLGGLSLGSF